MSDRENEFEIEDRKDGFREEPAFEDLRDKARERYSAEETSGLMETDRFDSSGNKEDFLEKDEHPAGLMNDEIFSGTQKVYGADGKKEQKKGDKEQEEKGTVKDEVISWVKTIVFAIILAILINTFVIVNATVPTGSMENTIMPKDRIIASRLNYYFSSPQRGDIVVFKYPDDESVLYVKRVIGLPGETVEIIDGKVYIDGSDVPLDDDYIKGEAVGNFGPYEVPEGSYFMLGDNRQDSIDSRYWMKKYVEEKKILGKVYLRYYPGVKFLD